MLDDDDAATARVVRDSSGKQTVPDTIMQQCGTYLALHNPLVRGYRLLKDVATLEAVDGRLADLVLVVHDETARPDPGTHPEKWRSGSVQGRKGSVLLHLTLERKGISWTKQRRSRQLFFVICRG